MYPIDCRKVLAQLAVVALLTCSVVARANDCAGGADATGNDCTGEQVAPGLGQAESHLMYVQGQAVLAELRVAQAKQRLIDDAVALKSAEAMRKSEEEELKTARMALKADKQGQQSLLAVRAR